MFRLISERVLLRNSSVHIFNPLFFSKDFHMRTTRFLNRQHFYKQCQTQIGKNQAKANQHAEAEFLLFENYLLSSSTLASKYKEILSKMYKKQVRLFKGYLHYKTIVCHKVALDA